MQPQQSIVFPLSVLLGLILFLLALLLIGYYIRSNGDRDHGTDENASSSMQEKNE